MSDSIKAFNENKKDQLEATTSVITVNPIDGSPLTIVMDDKGSHVCMGHIKLKTFETMAEAENDVSNPGWERIWQVINIVSEEILKLAKEANNE